MNYSQGGEQDVIVDIFRDVAQGRFLDAGAADGKTFSNTLALAERGWSGLCIEPSPAAFEALKLTHKDRPGITCLQNALGLDPHIVTFYDCPDLVGTTQAAHRDKWAKSGVPFKEIKVQQITFAEIIARYGAQWDFIGIDTEGTSADLFLRMPLAEMNPKAVCVEHDDRVVEICDFARALGYAPAYLDGNNLILCR